MKRITFLFGFLLTACFGNFTHAESKEMRAQDPHEFRVGAGTDLLRISWATPPNENIVSKGHRYILPYFFTEYKYRINHWFAVGVEAKTMWWSQYRISIDNKTGGEKLTLSTTGTVSIMPSAAFTYFHRDWVDFYSGIAAGYAIYMSTGYHTSVSYDSLELGHTWSVYANLFGVSIGKEHLFGAAELGLRADGNAIPSPQIYASIGYRF